MKEQLKDIDSKVDKIIRLLAPFLLNSATHKVLEYLIRIYEIHAYNKETLIFSFLPYFETAIFTRAIQLVSLKQDDFFYFLEQFAYKGENLDKGTLVKYLARNDCSLYSKYSKFCFELADLHLSMGGGFSNLQTL